jgi:hypothetical protein
VVNTIFSEKLVLMVSKLKKGLASHALLQIFKHSVLPSKNQELDLNLKVEKPRCDYRNSFIKAAHLPKPMPLLACYSPLNFNEMLNHPVKTTKNTFEAEIDTFTASTLASFEENSFAN